jgi:glutathione S-transferase
MSSTIPPLLFYDIASTRPRTWAPYCLRTALLLAHRSLPHERVFVSFPDIRPTLSALNVSADSNGDFTLPALRIGDDVPIMGSLEIAEALEALVPASPTHPGVFSLPGSREVARDINAAVFAPFRPLAGHVVPHTPAILDAHAVEFFERTRLEALGRSLATVIAEKEAAGERFEEIYGSVTDKWAEAVAAHQEVAEREGRGSGPYVMGDTVTYADFIVAGMVKWVESVRGEAAAKVVGKTKGGTLSRLLEALEKLLVAC